jgi:hypothetical protein
MIKIKPLILMIYKIKILIFTIIKIAKVENYLSLLDF